MMEHLPESNSGQGISPAAKQAASLGNMLREAREKLGLSIADVAGQIKFAPRQIEALEADDYKHLPEAAFLRGFVRSYAKILRLDAETLLASMPQTKVATAELIPASVDVPFPNAHSLRQQNMLWLGAASLLAVIVAGFALWHFKTPVKQAKVASVETPVTLPADTKIVSEPLVLKSSTIVPSAPATPKAQPVVAAQSSVRPAKTLASARDTKAPTPVPEAKAQASVREAKAQSSVRAAKTLAARDTEVISANTLALSGVSPPTAELRLVFGEESWTEIKDKDGKIISSQVNPRGSELQLQGNPPFTMLIGHAASASLYYRGKQVDLKPYINQYSEVAHLTLK
jgi:cytoskeleton protein RodZ